MSEENKLIPPARILARMHGESLKALHREAQKLMQDIQEVSVSVANWHAARSEEEDGEPLPDHRFGDIRDNCPSDGAVCQLEEVLDLLKEEVEGLGLDWESVNPHEDWHVVWMSRYKHPDREFHDRETDELIEEVGLAPSYAEGIEMWRADQEKHAKDENIHSGGFARVIDSTDWTPVR